jgi:hypothetical protein
VVVKAGGLRMCAGLRSQRESESESEREGCVIFYCYIGRYLVQLQVGRTAVYLRVLTNASPKLKSSGPPNGLDARQTVILTLTILSTHHHHHHNTDTMLKRRFLTANPLSP